MLVYTMKLSLAASSAVAALVSFSLPVAVCTARLIVGHAITYVNIACSTHAQHSMQQQDISSQHQCME